MVAAKTKTRSSRFAKGGFLRRVAWMLAGFSGVCLLGLAIAWSVWSRDADSFLTLFALRPVKTISKVLDRNDNIIGIFAEERRELIPYGDVPKAFINGLVATEDADFWDHGGVSGRGVLRAGWNFVSSLGQRREGASTLTMQLVRIVTAKRQRRLDRKFKEIILARKLEKAYTKKQILEQYSNEVYFGGGRYGLEAAAEFYFDKSAPQLSVDECAMLAGVVQNANYLYPYSRDPKTRQLVLNRRNHVLDRMVDEGYLKPADAKIFKEKPIRLARENPQEKAVAPYAVEEVRKYLYKKYGMDTVLNGGLVVYTTIDSAWQEAANTAVKDGLKAVDRRRGFRKESVQFVKDPETTELPGWKRFMEEGESIQGVILGWSGDHASVRVAKKTLKVPMSSFAWAGKNIPELLPRGAAPLFLVKEADDDGLPTALELDQEPDVEGALLAVDPPSGEIRAMVGGYDFKRSNFNRATQAQRQVGSTMKAFVYGAAFERGMSPATIVQDVPTRFTFGRTVYEPKDYERDYWGPITIWDALRDSRNVPAVRTLEATGVENVIGLARAAGVQGTLPPVPSMALGSADLSLTDMVRGYATFANSGKQSPEPFLIRKVLDRAGRVLENHVGKESPQALDPISNFQLIQCLQAVAQRGTGSRTNALEWPVAGKTGTTDDHTDAWFLGFSTRIACGVWVGLDAKKTIYRGADGGKVAVPIWVTFMKAALPTTQKESFQAPEGTEWADIDRSTGLIATSATGGDDVLHLAFKPGTLPKEPSTAEAIKKVREAKEKAHYQAADDRAWGFMVETSPNPASNSNSGPGATPGVDWSKEADPNK